jgi:hypothetical protein
VKIILVRIPEDAGGYFGALSDVGDDVYREFTLDGIAASREGPPPNELRIEVSATRHLGVVTTFVKKALKRYGMAEIAEIMRLD